MKRPANDRKASQFLAWWIKCDPTSAAHGGWNWPDLFREYRPGRPYVWSVGPSLSQKNACLARPGDPVLGYAAGQGRRELMALAEITQGGVFVPGEGPRRGGSPFRGGFTVAIRPVRLLEHPIHLDEVREVMKGTDPEFLRTRFGSIFKVTDLEFRRLVAAVRAHHRRAGLPAGWQRRARSR